MKPKKKLIALVASIGILAVAGTAYAADNKTPADIVAGLTGKTVTEVTTERAAGKTYGTLAKEAGKLEQFKTEMLEQRKAILDQRVKDGTLTQEQANSMLKAMETNQANCDGTGNPGIGCANGPGSGQGAMMGPGCGGMGRGAGMGRGYCQGNNSY